MRIAFFAPPMQGHLGPAHALAETLAKRGHKCFLVCHPATELSAYEHFVPLHVDASRYHWTPQEFIRHSRRPGLPFGVARIVSDMVRMTNSHCTTAPDLLRNAGIDGIVTDQMEAAGALVADHLDIPFVSLSTAHPINREPLIPLPVLPWGYEDTPWAVKRNRGGEWVADALTARHDRTIATWSAHWGLRPRTRLVDCLSPLADITQMYKGLDFPRRELADSFHYVGPIRSLDEPQPRSSAQNDATRPLVYVSLGSLQGHRLELLQRIAKACRSIGARVVVAHANALTPQQAASIDADEVLAWAPQAELLAQANAVVTHAGMNTVLDALSAAVPMLCVPLAFEQPGISARVAHSGAGEMLSSRAVIEQIATALRRIMTDPAYRQKASAIGSEQRAGTGAELAAGIIEQALSTRQPVRTGEGRAIGKNTSHAAPVLPSSSLRH